MPDSSESALNEREELILQAVVHTYITTAEPAGSRALVKRFNIDLSPATVRNVMSDLEDQGYLEQVHTSSGRVPTDQGYRYYVDYLMRVQDLTLSERTRIEGVLQRQLNDADEVLKQTSHLLALVSQHLGIVQAPTEEIVELRRIEVIPIEGPRVAVMLADSCGRIRTFSVVLGEQLADDDITRLSRLLNEALKGVALDRLASSAKEKLRTQWEREGRMADRAMNIVNALPSQPQGQLFLDGTTHLFAQPEFHDLVRAREVFGFIEAQDRLSEMLRSSWVNREEVGSRVLIGSENHMEGLEDISVVAAPYRVGDRTAGLVGILGPRRMAYSKATGVVEYTAELVSRFLTRLSGTRETTM